MSSLLLICLILVSATTLAYIRADLKTAAITSGVLLFLSLPFGAAPILSFLLVLSTLTLALLSIDKTRKDLISTPLFRWYKRRLPPISKTEQEAIDAGTLWWEGELFTGQPNWDTLLNYGKPQLSAKEQSFLEGPVEELCRMVDPWDVGFKRAMIPDPVLAHLKREKFFGMIIPEKYGGLELSAVAQTEVLSRLYPVGAIVGTFIVVPNSLGPGELLVKYGTQAQKDHYLPRLANGDEIPCFALTSPLAGSDATSISDTGIVCKGEWEGEEITGMRLSFDKRYITLAPVATLVGLAFKLNDPDHLMGDIDDYGITCALIPRDTAGLEIGNRHLPVGDPFLNGPVRGRDVFVPLDYIIGGRAMAGKGWRMLVNCLSAGRCISLPSSANGMARHAVATTGAYARIRKQFNIPIGQMEGVQKPLAKMAGLAYILNAARLHTAVAVDTGSKPAVASAILKYHCTEMARQIINDAFDIHAGKAVMKGRKNYLAAAYEGMPVSITVEGANIMTRSLMIFGQGVIRCHPYIFKEMQLAERDDEKQAAEAFDDVLFNHIGFALANGAKSFVCALTGSHFTRAPHGSPLRRYYQHANRFSAALAVAADMAMAAMQGALKRRQMISSRLGDLLSMLYLLSMVLKHHEDAGCPDEDMPLLHWACQYLLYRYQQAMLGIIQNFPSRFMALKLRLGVFPTGAHFTPPADKLEVEVADLMIHDSATRRRLIDGMYIESTKANPAGELDALLVEADPMGKLDRKLKDAVKLGQLPKRVGLERIHAGEAAGVISKDEADKLRDYEARIMDMIHVDEFAFDAFSRAETTGGGQSSKSVSES